MGYCDGAMDINLIKRNIRKFNGKDIFSYGKAYEFADGAECYGVKWKIEEMQQYDGHLIFLKKDGNVDIYDLDDAKVVKTVDLLKIL